MSDPKLNDQYENETDTIEDLEPPARYKVIMLNDDYTTMEFVIQVLTEIFAKGAEEAYNLMLLIHEKGSAVCGIYSYEIAESKIQQVRTLARKHSYPLRVVLEEEK